MGHSEYMRRAIELAKRGVGWTSPNPMVGAVIVKDGKIIGEGYHERCGDLHAERNAFQNLTASAEGSTLYVTLEPCCHHGKQPPCTDAIIEHGIQTVYIGSRDPNPLVSGKGVEILKQHRIQVIEDFLREECDAINDVFFHYITTKRPFVVTKYAMTMDGKIATRTGASKWITGEKAREHVQNLRGKYASILVGIGTVLADDPMLNCRIENAHQPLRIVLDSTLRIPLGCQLVQTAKQYPTLVVGAVNDSEDSIRHKIQKLQEHGVEVVLLPEEKNAASIPNTKISNALINNTSSQNSSVKVSIKKLLDYLGEKQIDSILVEGGGEIHDAFRQAGVINQVDCYIAPKIFGGSEAKTPVSGIGIANVEEALFLSDMQVTTLGDDILLEAKVVKN